VTSPAAPTGLGVRLGSALVSMATAFVLLGASILPFLTPAWIHFEQDRAGAAALTGLGPSFLYGVTDAIVHDLVLGGDFRVSVPIDGTYAPRQPVYLSEPDIAHMRDVRGVFGGFGLLALVGLGVLANAGRRARTADARRRTWTVIRRGASSLAVLMAVLGILAIGAFDAVFEVFHRLFFAPGTYTFDPATDHLVQLFPVAFWSETAPAFGAFVVMLSLAAAWLARRQAARAPADPMASAALPAAVPGSSAS
jgi:integral membrane protein (TIGR01906 family)